MNVTGLALVPPQAPKTNFASPLNCWRQFSPDIPAVIKVLGPSWTRWTWKTQTPPSTASCNS